MGGGGREIALKRKVIFFNILRTEQHITPAFFSFPIYETGSSPERLPRAINNGRKMTGPRRWTKTDYVRRPRGPARPAVGVPGARAAPAAGCAGVRGVM